MWYSLFEILPEPAEDYFTMYVRDSKKLRDDGDDFALLLKRQYNYNEYEHSFKALTEEEIKSIIIYIKDFYR